ncbi:hypothetical protein FHL15_008889 [Xylaria flabelliformis]|uniref:Heterokaryon incompatibility domain-containing protein n=1 Tax=Xylaria flabelliformis TaxID=2512241 RepID=A0A553HQC4_9PEZI|nr:hypothetical protein FHL15_008889 [Xylaria flabelliformis]
MAVSFWKAVAWNDCLEDKGLVEVDPDPDLLWLALALYARRSEGTELRLVIAIRDQARKTRLETRFELLPSAFLQLQLETSSSTSLDLAISWYQSCCTNHSLCNRVEGQKHEWMPSRLIDIGEMESQWKLVDVRLDNITPAPYFTLSYRWGLNQSLVLQNSTFYTFRREQPISDLPQTFKDAIHVIRRFSVRYLWIDALCIIQDNREDREREIPEMQRIYNRSACTLAASASEDPNGGLFRRRDPQALVPGTIAAPSAALRNENYHIFDNSYWDRHAINGPLHKRGWVFQERLLSPRVIYFGKSQISWECFTELKCEGFPYGIPKLNSVKKLDPLWEFQEPGHQPMQQRGKMPIHLLRLWNSLVREYSNCKLTEASDKLPAFAGISELFREVTGDQYICGMWRSSLLEQLNWWVDQPRPRVSTDYRAPSWSWASLDGPIRPHHQAARNESLVSILAVKSRYNHVDSAGILYHEIRLLGSLISSTELERPLQAVLYPDTLEVNLGLLGTFYFLPLQTASYELFSGGTGHRDLAFHTEVYCLLLEVMLCTLPITFRRVGHCILDGEDVFKLGLSIKENGLADIRDAVNITII